MLVFVSHSKRIVRRFAFSKAFSYSGDSVSNLKYLLKTPLYFIIAVRSSKRGEGGGGGGRSEGNEKIKKKNFLKINK